MAAETIHAIAEIGQSGCPDLDAHDQPHRSARVSARVGAGGVLMLGGPALLAACGGGTSAEGTTGGTGASGGGALNVDNWIEYIDVDDDGESPDHRCASRRRPGSR